MDVEFGPVIVTGYTADSRGDAISQILNCLREVLESRDSYNTGGVDMTRVEITIKVE
jgi:hypothetical protein